MIARHANSNMQGSRASLVSTLMALSLVSPLAHAQKSPAPLPLCQPTQLSLGTDGENGNFNGMSHSGTLLVLRNISPSACRLQPIPQLALQTSQGKPVSITITQSNPFTGPTANGKRLPMGHGPAVVPILLAPAAEATLTLRWVSGNVYDHGTCVTPASILVTLEGGTLQTPFSGSLCGPDPAHIAVTATRLATDPTP